MSYNDYKQWFANGHIVIDPNKVTGIQGTSAPPDITITGETPANPEYVAVGTGTGEVNYTEGVGLPPEEPTNAGGTNTGSVYADIASGTETGTGTNNGGTGTGSNIYDTAKDTVNKNHQLGIDYAEGVKNSAYQRADNAEAEANRRAQNQYQRTVVDSQSSYQRAIGAYGSNAETLASRGLSGSGYGEWLQGNAYATHRGEVQSAAAQRLAMQNDAAYKAAEAKAAADADYEQFLYQNEVNKNNALQGIEEQEASDAEAKVNTAFTTALDLLNKGWTLEDVQKYLGAEAWAALGDKVGQLEAAKAVADRIKKETEGKDAQGQLLSYLQLAATGEYTLDQLVAIAKSLGQYDALSAKDEKGNSLWDQVANKVQSNTDKQTVQDMIDNGATKEEIENSDAYKNLPDADKGTADKLITERDEGIKETENNEQLAIEAAIEEAMAYTSLKELESDLVKEMVPESKRSEIIAGWQKKNADEFVEDLKSVKGTDVLGVRTFTIEDVIADIKAGRFGKNDIEVVNAVVDLYLKTAIETAATNITKEQVRGYLETLETFWEGYNYTSEWGAWAKLDTTNKIKSAIESINKLIIR